MDCEFCGGRDRRSSQGALTLIKQVLKLLSMTANVFLAIADPTRRRLLDLLARGDSDVSTLAARFKCSLPAVSQHLRKLRDARLVTVKAQGNRRLYRLRARPLKTVHDWTTAYEAFWAGKLRALAEHLEKNP